MWATKRAYRGGVITGYKLIRCTGDGLKGGYQYTNISCSDSFLTIPPGRYYVSVLAAEYDSDSGSYITQDYVTFRKKATF